VDFLNYLFSMAALWLWAALAIALLALIYLKRDSSFAIMDFLYTFPLIGRLARYSKDYSEANRGVGWLNVENTLCRDYARHCTAISQAEFDNNIRYLKKTYDHGRREIPFWVMGLLALLIILEGLGFSYLLGGFMAMEGSENTRQALMVAIVLVLATILVWVTHHAGHQWFRTSLLRHCFREYQKNKDKAFTSQIVSLDEDQSIDQSAPSHVQCANRVVSKPGDLGNHAWVWIAGVLILSIAVGSTILRMETLHTSQIEASREAAAPVAAPEGLPSDLAAALTSPAAPDAGVDPAAASKEYAALAGFVMLAIIFIVTQLVGAGVGLRYGFAGKQSRLAHGATGGHAEYGSYFAPIEHRMMIANSRLLRLHQLLEKHSPTPIVFTKDFFDFVDEERARGATYLHKPPPDRSASLEQKRLAHYRAEHAAAPEAAGPSEAETAGEAEGATQGGDDGAAARTDETSAEVDPVSQSLVRIGLATDPGEKIAIIEALEPELRNSVMASMADRKAATAERDALRRRIEELL
jgi:Flp pilus assembly pilin Flp